MLFVLSTLAAAQTLTQKPQRLLEITTRPYLYLLSQRYGKSITKLSQIPDEILDDWKAKGFEWIWFMGIWQLGTKGLEHDYNLNYNDVLPGWTKEDVIGSPYCIVSYTVNTELGTADDLKNLRTKLHNRGMKLMVDFVPNHSAMDAPEIQSNPKFYIQAPSGVKDNNVYMDNGIAFGCGEWCSPWTDVAQFNYMDADFRANRIATLKKIASMADGMRCDMAHLILADKFWDYWKVQLEAHGYSKNTKEFWAEAISAVKAEYPNCVFMSESYGDVLQKLQQCGFDFTYNKDPLDRLRDGDPSGFKYLVWNNDLQKMAHFTENHDEPRSVANQGGNVNRANAAAAALLTLPGMRFFNQEQWNGYTKKIDVHLRRAVSENINSDCVAWYNKLFAVLNTDALKNGEFTLLGFNGSDSIFTWKWVKGSQHILVAVNFANGQSGGSVVLDDAPTTGSTIPVTDMMTGDVYNRDPNELRSSGLVVVLGAYQVQVMSY